MKLKPLFFSAFLFLIVTACNNEKEKSASTGDGGCDSLAVTKAFLANVYKNGFTGDTTALPVDSILKKYSLDITNSVISAIKSRPFRPDEAEDKSIATIKRSLQPRFGMFSGPIDADEARETHLAYLQNSPMLDQSGNIIHFMSVSGGDLTNLARNGTNGMRLYFCRESKNNDLSIILVAVNGNSDNVLDTAGSSAIVNKLLPCPDNCYKLGYNSKNEMKDLNYDPTNDRWYKPNIYDPASTSEHYGHWWNSTNTITKDN